MHDDLVKRMQDAKQAVELRRTERLRLEAREGEFSANLEKLKAELRERGVEPSQLDDLIAQAEAEVVEKLTALETALNG